MSSHIRLPLFEFFCIISRYTYICFRFYFQNFYFKCLLSVTNKFKFHIYRLEILRSYTFLALSKITSRTNIFSFYTSEIYFLIFASVPLLLLSIILIKMFNCFFEFMNHKPRFFSCIYELTTLNNSCLYLRITLAFI